jgi:hypothetical protein
MILYEVEIFKGVKSENVLLFCNSVLKLTLTLLEYYSI